MGGNVCSNCQNNPGQYNAAFSSINQMEVEFKKYAQNNLLGLYGRRLQTAIEKLFTLEQFHICDLLIKLSTEKKTEERDKLLLDIEGINLEQLDHLTLIEQGSFKQQSGLQNASNIYLGEQHEDRMLKMIQRKNLKHKQLSKQNYQNILQHQKFVIFATIECFGNHNSFEHLRLPTRRSALQIFLEKVQAVNVVNHCSLTVVFIVNPEYQRQFDAELDRILKIRDLESSRDTETSLFDFKVNKVLYKPVFPCVDDNRKIIVDGNRIKFNYSNGDFLGFCMKDQNMSKYLQKYQFIQIANVNNLVEEVAAKQSLTYLSSHPETSITLHAYEANPNFEIKNYIRLEKSFLENKQYRGQKLKKALYSLSETYYLRSSLLKEVDKYQLYHKIISTRFKAQKVQNVIEFVRTLQSVLYAPLSLIVIDDAVDEDPVNKSSEVLYSNYCKKRIGLKQTADNELVEICPQILFGKKEYFQKIIQKLRQLPRIGFPLVINRQKTQSLTA